MSEAAKGVLLDTRYLSYPVPGLTLVRLSASTSDQFEITGSTVHWHTGRFHDELSQSQHFASSARK